MNSQTVVSQALSLDELFRGPWFVYQLFDEAGDVLYVGSSTDVRKRVTSHRRARWGHEIARVGIEELPDRASMLQHETRMIGELRPRHNVSMNPSPLPGRTFTGIMAEEVGAYLEEKEAKRKAKATMEQYRFVLTRVWMPWTVETRLHCAADCDVAVLERFQTHLLSETNLSVASVRSYVRSVRVFLRWAGIATDKFETVKEPRRLRDTLTREEINRMEQAARTERDKLIVRVLADTGLRVSELLGLRTGDLRQDLRNHRCFVRVIGKGNVEREVGIPEATFKRLQRFAATGAGSHIFMGPRARLTKNGAEQAIRRIAIQARIGRRVWPHLFRHSFITQQIRSGRVNLIDIQKHVGHTTLAMISQIYSHTTADDSYDALMAGLK